MGFRGVLVGVVVLCAACGGAPRATQPGTRPSAPATARSSAAKAPGTSLTPDTVLSTIQTKYMRDLKRCYGRQLKKYPRLAGRVTVLLTVDGRGRLSEGRARGITDAVETCVERAMERWSFPPSATAEQSFQLSFQLRPT